MGGGGWGGGFESAIAPFSTSLLKIFAPFSQAKFIYFSINPTKITFFLFYKNLFSILNFTASGSFRTAATSEMEWSFFVTAVND